MPAMDALNIGWLEEPFPAHDHHHYRQAAGYGHTPLAAGENHFTRFEIHPRAGGPRHHHLAAGPVEVRRHQRDPAHRRHGERLQDPDQPAFLDDRGESGGLDHLLAAIENAGYFEADVSKGNLFRDALGSEPWRIGGDGNVLPLDAPGIGVEVDEAFLAAHPAIEGPGYV